MEDDNIFLSHQLTKTVITDDILNTYIGMQNEQRYKQGGEKRKQDSMIKCLDPPSYQYVDYVIVCMYYK